MEVQGRTVLVLGGAGMVGRAVCRRLLEEGAAHLIVASIDQESAEAAVTLLRRFARPDAKISSCWGNLFVRWELKDLSWPQILAAPVARRQLLADLLDPMTGERKRDIIQNSTLYRFVQEFQPHGIIDCINTATAFAYQNIYGSAHELLAAVAVGEVEAIRDRGGTAPVQTICAPCGATPADPDRSLHCGGGGLPARRARLHQGGHQRHRRHGAQHPLHPRRGKTLLDVALEGSGGRRAQPAPLPVGAHPPRSACDQRDQTHRGHWLGRDRLRPHPPPRPPHPPV